MICNDDEEIDADPQEEENEGIDDGLEETEAGEDTGDQEAEHRELVPATAKDQEIRGECGIRGQGEQGSRGSRESGEQGSKGQGDQGTSRAEEYRVIVPKNQRIRRAWEQGIIRSGERGFRS